MKQTIVPIASVSLMLIFGCLTGAMGVHPKLCQIGLVVNVSAYHSLGRGFACVWNCLWGHALKRYPGINHKSRVMYPGPGILSSATWPLLLKNHYNGLIMYILLVI